MDMDDCASYGIIIWHFDFDRTLIMITTTQGSHHNTNKRDQDGKGLSPHTREPTMSLEDKKCVCARREEYK